MDIYKKKSRWKIYLAIAGLIVLLASLFYSNYLAKKLANGEKNKAIILSQAYYYMESDSAEIDANGDIIQKDVSFQLDIIRNNNDIPILVVDPTGVVTFGRNFGEENEVDSLYLAKQLEIMKRKGNPPIELKDQLSNLTIYYKNTEALNLLTWFPLIQFLLLMAFIAIGYFAFSSARKGEQNRVWAGMAKETAHQLGTPISAIIAWIEHLKELNADKPDTLEIVGELRSDVERLELIADRFSKIGSAPVLKSINLFDELDKTKVYMQRRSSRRIKYAFPDGNHAPLMVKINPPLFNWVIENIIRNALDAMGAEGTISAKISEENNEIVLLIKDTGKGISPSLIKTVFQPGFTTKKRGWGLGLSLAKRIIDNYHGGRIYVKESKIDEGTTFAIHLPK